MKNSKAFLGIIVTSLSLCFACAGVDSEETAPSSATSAAVPELVCEQVASGDIRVSGCSTTGGCWGTFACNRKPGPDDYMGPAVVCGETAVVGQYLCRW